MVFFNFLKIIFKFFSFFLFWRLVLLRLNGTTSLVEASSNHALFRISYVIDSSIDNYPKELLTNLSNSSTWFVLLIRVSSGNNSVILLVFINYIHLTLLHIYLYKYFQATYYHPKRINVLHWQYPTIYFDWLNITSIKNQCILFYSIPFWYYS